MNDQPCRCTLKRRLLVRPSPFRLCVDSGLIRAWFRLDRGFYLRAEQEAPRSQGHIRVEREDERPVYPIMVGVPRPEAARRIAVVVRRQHRR